MEEERKEKKIGITEDELKLVVNLLSTHPLVNEAVKLEEVEGRGKDGLNFARKGVEVLKQLVQTKKPQKPQRTVPTARQDEFDEDEVQESGDEFE